MEPEWLRSVLPQTFGSSGAVIGEIGLTTNIRLLGAGMAKIRLTTNIRLLWSRNGKDPSYYKHSAPMEPEPEWQRSVLLQTFGSYGAVSGEDRPDYKHSAPMEP